MNSDEEREERERVRQKEAMFDASFGVSEQTSKLKEIDAEQREKIKAAILKSTSIEEVERLNKMLQAGYIPE